jgi:hypothetical protein
VDVVGTPVGEKGRAQIACLTCRKSKTRCVNQGSGSTCKHCAERNKVCQWGECVLEPAATGSFRRRESTVGDVDVSALFHYSTVSAAVIVVSNAPWVADMLGLICGTTLSSFISLP